MPITVTCRRCSHEFSAWDDLAGQLVECPQCQSDVYVGNDEDEWEDDEEGEEEDDEFRLAPPEESLLSPTSLALPVTGEAEVETELSDTPPADCPKCGADLKGDLLCEACNYHVKLRRVLNSDVESFQPDDNLGFKRWFNSQLAEGESFDTVFFWVKIVFGFLLALFTFLLFPYSLIITIPIVAGIVFLYVFVKRSPKSGDDAFYDAGTQFSLKLARSLGWRKMSWPFDKLKHFRGTADFDDDDLSAMENNGEIEALDLEGCPITDAGLVHLEDWTQLKYLVLTGTEASREGVVELQFKLKQTLIWY